VLPGQIISTAYDKLPDIKSLDLEFGVASDQVRDKTGIFSYAVGNTLHGLLVAAASVATTSDGSTPQRVKPDATRYAYNGRSYGIGSAIGLVVNKMLGNVISYEFDEVGYYPHVNCIYNKSSLYTIETVSDDFGGMSFYAATGYLPNSNMTTDPERDPMAGFNTNNLVTFGTARAPINSERILTIAAGNNYKYLDKAQCNIDFVPTSFKVRVSTNNRTILVQPLPSGPRSPADVNPSGTLSLVAMRQFTSIQHESSDGICHSLEMLSMPVLRTTGLRITSRLAS
jgi:hypothetical protein